MMRDRTDTAIEIDPFGTSYPSSKPDFSAKQDSGIARRDSNILLQGTQKEISDLMWDIKEMLIEKNRKYGDSALEPSRIYSTAPPLEQINVRIDDKLSRIKSGQTDEDEDIDLDLIGYLVLRIIAKRRIKSKPRDDVKYKAEKEKNNNEYNASRTSS